MKSLELPHLPDMLFLYNHLTLHHEAGLNLTFNPLDALKRVNAHEDLVHVAMSQVGCLGGREGSRVHKLEGCVHNLDGSVHNLEEGGCIT